MKLIFNKVSDWKKKHSSLLFYILMMAWPMAQYLVFYIGVNFNSFLLAFQSYDQSTSTFKWVGLENFQRLWVEFTELDILKTQLFNSVLVWFLTIFSGTVITLILSYYIYKKFRGSSFFRVIMFLPSIIPGMILVMVFKIFVNEALPKYLELLGMNVGPLATLDADTRFAVAVFYTVFMGLGGQMLVYTGTMSQISPSITEAAMLDGITPLKELWYIVIPQLMPTISTYLVAGLAGIFSNQASLLSFYSFYVFPKERTIGYQIFVLINGPGNGYSEYGYASAIGLCCSVVAIVLTFTARYFLTKKED